MSSDIPNVIEDDPYQGVFHGRGAAAAAKGRAGSAAEAERPYRFHLAEMLKQTRLARGWTLEQVSEMTRVRRAYLEALEQAAYDVLPSRAFAIGHVKAYAKVLGLDEETLADMFKTEVAETNTRLQAPSGASLDDVRPNYRLYVSGAMCLVAAIAVWNVVQHNPDLLSSGKSHRQANLDSQPWSLGVPMIRDGVIYVTRPAPPPKDQDIPAPYVTPGLEEGFASIMATSNHEAQAPVPVQDVQTRKAFNPRGAVYGATPENSAVTVQASKSVNLIVRGGDNTVYFAHELGDGEAYRLPLNGQQDLTIEVSDPAALEIYYNGEYAGALDGPVTTVGKLNGRAAQMSAVLDARQAQLGQASAAHGPAPAPEKPQLAQHSDAPIPYMPASHALAPPPVKLPPKAAHAAAAASASAAAVEKSAAKGEASPAAAEPAAVSAAPVPAASSSQ